MSFDDIVFHLQVSIFLSIYKLYWACSLLNEILCLEWEDFKVLFYSKTTLSLLYRFPFLCNSIPFKNKFSIWWTLKYIWRTSFWIFGDPKKCKDRSLGNTGLDSETVALCFLRRFWRHEISIIISVPSYWLPKS